MEKPPPIRVYQITGKEMVKKRGVNTPLTIK
jgi:hypothetical protein